MNKEQSLLILVDLIRVKNMLNSTISAPELPWCCNCMYRTPGVSEAFRAIEAALVKHDNNMKDYS